MDSFINNFDSFDIANPFDYSMNSKQEERCSQGYISEYLKKHIGKMIKLECYFGSNLEIRIGQLIEVSDKYIVLRLYKPSTTILCDINSIKFVTIAHGNEVKNLI